MDAPLSSSRREVVLRSQGNRCCRLSPGRRGSHISLMHRGSRHGPGAMRCALGLARLPVESFAARCLPFSTQAATCRNRTGLIDTSWTLCGGRSPLAAGAGIMLIHVHKSNIPSPQVGDDARSHPKTGPPDAHHGSSASAPTLDYRSASNLLLRLLSVTLSSAPAANCSPAYVFATYTGRSPPSGAEIDFSAWFEPTSMVVVHLSDPLSNTPRIRRC